MARMPEAEWVGPQGDEDLMTRYDVVCVHTIVGFAPAHAAHFSTKAAGKILQSRDTRFQSDANYQGNYRVIAVENEDHGPAFGGTPKLPGWVPLTKEQVLANAKILAWSHDEHGVPLQMCPNSRPESRGLGYHRQGIDGNFNPPTYKYPGRVPGGELWTLSPGKVCPTDIRIAQLPEILAIAKEGDEMALSREDKDWIRKVMAEEVAKSAEATQNLIKNRNQAWLGRWRKLQEKISRGNADVREISEDVNTLVADMEEENASE